MKLVLLWSALIFLQASWADDIVENVNLRCQNLLAQHLENGEADFQPWSKWASAIESRDSATVLFRSHYDHEAVSLLLDSLQTQAGDDLRILSDLEIDDLEPTLFVVHANRAGLKLISTQFKKLGPNEISFQILIEQTSPVDVTIPITGELLKFRRTNLSYRRTGRQIDELIKAGTKPFVLVDSEAGNMLFLYPGSQVPWLSTLSLGTKTVDLDESRSIQDWMVRNETRLHRSVIVHHGSWVGFSRSAFNDVGRWNGSQIASRENVARQLDPELAGALRTCTKAACARPAVVPKGPLLIPSKDPAPGESAPERPAKSEKKKAKKGPEKPAQTEATEDPLLKEQRSVAARFLKVHASSEFRARTRIDLPDGLKEIFQSVLHAVVPPAEQSRIDEKLEAIGFASSDGSASYRIPTAKERFVAGWKLLCETLIGSVPDDLFSTDTIDELNRQFEISKKLKPKSVATILENVRKLGKVRPIVRPLSAPIPAFDASRIVKDPLPITESTARNILDVLRQNTRLGSLGDRDIARAFVHAASTLWSPQDKQDILTNLSKYKAKSSDYILIKGRQPSAKLLGRIASSWRVLSEVAGVPAGRVITQAQISAVQNILERARRFSASRAVAPAAMTTIVPSVAPAPSAAPKNLKNALKGESIQVGLDVWENVVFYLAGETPIENEAETTRMLGAIAKRVDKGTLEPSDSDRALAREWLGLAPSYQDRSEALIEVVSKIAKRLVEGTPASLAADDGETVKRRKLSEGAPIDELLDVSVDPSPESAYTLKTAQNGDFEVKFSELVVRKFFDDENLRESYAASFVRAMKKGFVGPKTMLGMKRLTNLGQGFIEIKVPRSVGNGRLIGCLRGPVLSIERFIVKGGGDGNFDQHQDICK